MIKSIVLITLVISTFAEVISLTTDNLQSILENQIKEFEKPEKKQKGLLLTFVTRADKTL